MRFAALVLLTALVVACGQQQPAARTSPSPTPSPVATPGATPSPSPTPVPLSQPYAVLATPPFGATGATPNYTLSIVGADGKVAASTSAATRSGLRCTFGQVNAGVVLPIETLSATADRVYYLDGNTELKWLAPDGRHGTANPVPGGASVGSTFAVSPDDRRIAVVSADYSQSPIPYRIYVEDVAGGNRTQIFSSTSDNLVPWAMGWHAGKLVLGYAPSCTQGGGPYCCSPSEVHLVDAATATRSATLGSASTCPTRSDPSLAGVICEQVKAASPTYSVVGWDGSGKQSIELPDNAFSMALSPGGVVAGCCSNSGQVLVGSGGNAHPIASGVTAQDLGFIDDRHLVLAGVTAQDQPRIVDVTNDSAIALNVLGEFVGRIPGGL
jgi:hypothetical protein